MRLRKVAGMILILVGSSGLALTALVIREPNPVDSYYEQDPLDPPAPSALDAWLMGMAFAGLTGAGVWILRAANRPASARRRSSLHPGAPTGDVTP